MESTEFAKWLYEETFKAAVNQLYSQDMAWYWEFADRGASIMVGALARFGVASAAGKFSKKTGFSTALVAVFIAWILLVCPTGTYKSEYGRQYQQWSDIRQSLEDLSHEFNSLKDKTSVPEGMIDRQREITGRMNAIASTESATWRSVMVRCQEDWTEHLYGKGIRTPDDVEKYLKQRSAGRDAKSTDKQTPARGMASR